MPTKTRQAREGGDDDLATFACPNPDCDRFNQFAAGNLTVVERTGKNRAIRRLYCSHCQRRFSERQGSLMRYTKLPAAAVVRVVKCLGHGCSVEATADICDVDPRTVERLLERAGRRAEDFHRLQLQRLPGPPGAVEMDELHGRVCKPAGKKGADVRPTQTQTPAPTLPRNRDRRAVARAMAAAVAAAAGWDATGSTRRWL
jgi:transposase-like protein